MSAKEKLKKPEPVHAAVLLEHDPGSWLLLGRFLVKYEDPMTAAAAAVKKNSFMFRRLVCRVYNIRVQPESRFPACDYRRLIGGTVVGSGKPVDQTPVVT